MFYMTDVSERVAAAEQYAMEQTEAVKQVVPLDVGRFVLASVHKLAAEYFQPAIHGLSAQLPETPAGWLSSFLFNGADDTLVNPDFTGALPACVREGTPNSPRDNVLISDDGGLLKMQTSSDYSESDGSVYMKIVSYGYATQTQAETYRRNRAFMHDVIPEDATILVPRAAARYAQFFLESTQHHICTYDDPAVGAKSVRYYSQSPESEPSPEDWIALHSGFMQVTQSACRGLESLLRHMRIE